MSKLIIEKRVLLSDLEDLTNEKESGTITIEGYTNSQTRKSVIRFLDKNSKKRILSVSPDVISEAIKLFRLMMEKDLSVSNPDEGYDRILNVKFGSILMELHSNEMLKTPVFYIWHAEDKKDVDSYAVVVNAIENVLEILEGDNHGR